MARSLAAGNLRATASVVALVAVATLLFAGRAAAAAPVIGTVGADNGYAGATWSLPAGVEAEFYEVASDPETTVFSPGFIGGGHFMQRNLVRFSVLDPGQTCVIDEGPPLSTGIYYFHVAGHDTAPGALRVEFSETKRLVVLASGNVFNCPAGSGGSSGNPGGGDGGGFTAKDRDDPACTLRYARRQRLNRLFVRARTNEAGTLSARAVVRVPGVRKAVHFRLVSRKARPGRFTKLRLKLKRNSRRAALRSLRSGQRLSARVIVTARDGAGNTQRRRVKIRLRP